MSRFWVMVGLVLGLASSVQAKQPPFVVILLPGTSLQGWRAAHAPHLHQLMASGALAVMNTRTARLPNDHTRETPESAALTLGAGARAAGGPAAADFLPPSAIVPDVGIRADMLAARRVGKGLPPSRSVNVHWPEILSANERLGYGLRLGNLADALSAKDVRVSAGGGRFAACVAAESDGSVHIAPRLTVEAGQCLIWDAGSNVPAADILIGSVAAQMALDRGRLMIVSPFAGDADYGGGRRLTPVMEWGAGIPAGLLRSPSTRRAGLVINTDIAPTIATYFGIRREEFPVRPFGEAWTALAAPNAERQAGALEEQAMTQAAGMKVLPYLAVALAAWMIGGTALSFRRPLPAFWPVVPLALLISLVFSTTKLSWAVSFAVLLTVGGVLTARAGNRKVGILLSGLLAAVLILDMLTGSRLMQRGLLGYSAVEGARFYGIGNEAMGVLIGTLLVLTIRLWQPLGRARWTLFLLLGTVTLLLGSSGAGAKAGGLLVALAAFGALAFSLLGGRWSGRTVLILALAAAAVMLLVAVGDAIWRHGEQSHIGEAMRRIENGGWTEAADIVTRKIAVEGRLVYHSAWAFPLWGGVICLSWLWGRQATVVPEERALRVAGGVALAACVILNDAGVVAGALCLIPLWCDGACAVTGKKPLRQQMLPQGQ